MSRDDDVKDEITTQEAEEAGEDSGDSGDEVASTSDASQASAGGEGKKKKKKKKKNKRGKAAGENGSAASTAGTQPAPPKVDQQEADRKFAAALKAIKDEDLWVELNSSNIRDAKLKKLLEPLKKNQSVTSINLSQNHLTDEAAQAILSSLSVSTAVPGLITLDLRENNFTQEGLTVLDNLKSVRRDLTIMTGAILPPEPPAPPPGKAGANDKAMRDLSDSRLVRKYFQIGNEEEEENNNGVAMVTDLVIDPADLWTQLSAALAKGTAGIPSQQGLLKHLAQQVHSELGSIADGEYARNVPRCPHVKACLSHLDDLKAVMQLVPNPVTVQYSSQPQAAVGSHRVFAAEAIANLVASQSTDIDKQLAAAKLVPLTLHVAISHPLSSALHARALRLLRFALLSKVEDLVGAMLVVPGWGMGLTSPAYAAGEKGGEGDAGLCPPLPTFLAQQAALAVGVVGGKRLPVTGFLIEASKLLHSLVHTGYDSDSDSRGEDPHLEHIRLALAANNQWSEYTDPEAGAYAKLLKELEGDLGGPRAMRSANTLEGSELVELTGGGLLTGPELLAMLQGMSLPSS